MIKKPPVIERIKIAYDVFRRGYPQRRWNGEPSRKQKYSLIWPKWRLGEPDWHIVDLQSYIDEGFNLNTLIYSAIMYKWRSVTAAPLRAYGGDPDHPELLEADHPLAKLVDRPNPAMSGVQLMGLCTIYQNLAGYAPILMLRPVKGGLPEKMIPLRPDRFYVVPDKTKGGVMGYLYIPEGKQRSEGIPILAQDCAFPKFPNPGDPLDGFGYGLSPMSPLANSADVDNMVTKFLKLFFEHGTMLTGLLKFEDTLNDEEVARAKARWMEMYGSYENWTEIGVLDKGGDYKQLGMTFDEMGFEVLDERNESRILGPFGVPPILIGSRLGLARSTYSNYEQCRKAFWEDTMVPELGLFENELKYFLQSDDGGFVKFDMSGVPALRKNVPELVTAWGVLVDHGVTKNNATKATGLENLGEFPDGDVIYMPINMIPMGRPKPALPTGVTPDTETSQTDNQGAAEAEAQAQEGTPKASPFRKGWTPEQKAAHWKAIDRIATAWEPKFGEGVVKAFETDKREILALLTEAGKSARKRKATIDWQEFLLKVIHYIQMGGKDNWREVFAPLIRGVITDQAERWAVELGLQFNVENLFASEWFDQYLMKFSQAIGQTTIDDISAIMAQAEREGWSIPDMQKHLGEVFDQYMNGDLTPEDFAWFEERMPAYRRELIARDQTMRASNGGNHELYSEFQVSEREWLSTKDDRVRDDHLAMDGRTAKMDEAWSMPDGSQVMFPGDDSLGAPLGQIIQCRCTEIPVIPEGG
jgi:HK97 family phage portal protein